MAEFDGQIVIDARLNTNNIDKEFENLKKNTESNNRSLQRQIDILKNLKQNYIEFSQGISKTPEQLKFERSLINSNKEISSLTTKYNELLEIQKQLNSSKSFTESRGGTLQKSDIEFLNKTNKEIENIGNKLEEAQKSADFFKKKLAEVKLNPELTNSVLRLDERIEKLSSNIAKSQSKFSNIDTNISKSFSRLGSGIGKIFSILTSPIKGAISSILSLGKSFLRIGKQAFIFYTIRHGFISLRDAIYSALAINSWFVKSLNQIQSNLITAFYPIYQYVLPGLQLLMSALVKASGYLAQFISMLFGKNYADSQAGAKSLVEQAQALNDNTKATNKNKKAYNELGKSIKKTKVELASFDKLNVLTIKDDKKDKDKFTFSPTVEFDENFDRLTDWWMNFLNILDLIRNKLNELWETFKKGFKFGFVDNNLNDLQNKIQDIGQHLKEIFTDPEIKKGFNDTILSIIYALGSLLGAITSIGTTIAKALLGGFEKFLDENKEQIKSDLNSFFNITIDFSNFISQFSNAIANIFSVFGNETSQQIISDAMTILYDIFVRGFLKIYQFVVDISKAIFMPFITHQEDIKKALEGMLEGVSSAISGIKTIINSFMDFIDNSYNSFIKPIIEEFGKIWDDVVGILLDGWNKYISPVIKQAGNAIKEIVEENIKPFIDTLGDLVKSFADFLLPILRKTWEFLKPFISFLIDGFFDGVGKAISLFVEIAKRNLQNFFDFFKGVANILSGIFDIISSIFSRDWDKLWHGAGKIISGFGDIFKVSINSIIDGINFFTKMFRDSINWIINRINSIHIDIPDWIPGIGGKSFGINIPNIPDDFAKIPRLAQGAVLKGGNPILAYINDQPIGQTNIETPLDTMVQAFKTALNSNETSYNNNITIQANGDLNSIISLLDFKIKQNNQRIGTNYVTGDVWI